MPEGLELKEKMEELFWAARLEFAVTRQLKETIQGKVNCESKRWTMLGCSVYLLDA